MWDSRYYLFDPCKEYAVLQIGVGGVGSSEIQCSMVVKLLAFFTELWPPLSLKVHRTGKWAIKIEISTSHLRRDFLR